MSDKYYLVTIDTNWADEMDIDAHIAMNQKEYNDWQKNFSKLKFPINVSIGTNEDLEIEKNEIVIREITQDDYETLEKLKLKQRGFTNCIDIEYYGDDEEDEDEDEDSPDNDGEIS